MKSIIKSEDVPLFSVIVPCYNSEPYLRECLESVACQSFSSWEIVAVDDGSIDGTGPLLDEFSAGTNGCMKVLHTENRGQILARQEAVRLSRGLYIVFLDSDDMLRPDCLELLSKVVRDFPNSIVQYRYCREPGFSVASGPPLPEGVKPGIRCGVKKLRQAVCESSSFNNLCGKCIPRQLLSGDKDYSEFIFMRNGEDLLQLIEVLNSGKTVVFIEDILYFYRMNENSVTSTFHRRFYDSVRAASDALWKAAAGWGDGDYGLLLSKRWMGSVSSSVSQLARSGLSNRAIRGEMRRFAEDPMTLEAWGRAAGDLGGRTRLISHLLMSGRYRTLLALIRIADATSHLRDWARGLLARGRDLRWSRAANLPSMSKACNDATGNNERG